MSKLKHIRLFDGRIELECTVRFKSSYELLEADDANFCFEALELASTPHRRGSIMR
jgi:hypothetical protein